MTTLRPETLVFLKSLAYRPGLGTLRRGSNQRRGYMGRSRLYANRIHGGYTKARAASAMDHVKRMMAGYHQHAGSLRRKMDLIDRIHADAPHLLPHAQRLHEEMQGHMRSAQSYARLASVRKDLDAGDAHISTAIGNSAKRSRRPKKYPPLSFAYGSTAP